MKKTLNIEYYIDLEELNSEQKELLHKTMVKNKFKYKANVGFSCVSKQLLISEVKLTKQIAILAKEVMNFRNTKDLKINEFKFEEDWELNSRGEKEFQLSLTLDISLTPVNFPQSLTTIIF